MDQRRPWVMRTMGLLLMSAAAAAACGGGSQTRVPQPPAAPNGDTVPSPTAAMPDGGSASDDAGSPADMLASNPSQLWLYGIDGSESNLALTDQGPPSPY